MNMRKTLAAAALLLASVGVAAADPIPNRYKFDYTFVQKLFGRPYYKCDFTSRTVSAPRPSRLLWFVFKIKTRSATIARPTFADFPNKAKFVQSLATI